LSAQRNKPSIPRGVRRAQLRLRHHVQPTCYWYGRSCLLNGTSRLYPVALPIGLNFSYAITFSLLVIERQSLQQYWPAVLDLKLQTRVEHKKHSKSLNLCSLNLCPLDRYISKTHPFKTSFPILNFILVVSESNGKRGL
jgi:hypothetical protein